MEGEGGDDFVLIARSLNGDTEAFSELVVKYQRPIYFTALRMLADHEEASDIAQQTFINGFSALRTFRREAQFKTWLMQIAMNLCRNRIKERTRQPEFEDIMETDVADRGELPLDRLTDQESAAQIRQAISHLPHQQRATVILRVQEGYSYEQIAQILGCAQETARAHFYHGVRALRKALTVLPGEEKA